MEVKFVHITPDAVLDGALLITTVKYVLPITHTLKKKKIVYVVLETIWSERKINARCISSFNPIYHLLPGYFHRTVLEFSILTQYR